MRSRFFRFSDRASYKTSEVMALFLIGLFLSAVTVFLCLLVQYVVESIFGPAR